MSGIGHEQEVLKPILLRSSTPAPNEKVLNYLEGMSREGDEVDNTPPRSMYDPTEYRSKAGTARTGPMSPRLYSPVPKSRNGGTLLDVAREQDERDDDVDSNIQEGRRSEAGETALPVREPGPNDPPGPKYESYDSGPSFGNFGPLPVDDHPSHNPYAHSSWNPDWTQTAQRVPLPASEFLASPRGTAMGIDAENPSSRSRMTQSRASQKAPSAISEHHTRGPSTEVPMSPKAPSRTQSRAATNKGDDQRPLSPLSMKSRITTRTRATEKGTVYPALPESRIGDEETNFEPASPRSRSQVVRSKAASVSPSDSPSQARPNQSPSKTPSRKGPSVYDGRSQPPGSVMSGGGHQSRPFSPYRHAPTTEDLLHAALRGRALAIPEEDEKQTQSRHSRAGSVVQSIAQSAARSQRSKAPSAVNGKTASHISAAKQPSIVSSKQTRDGDATPRPRSPNELDQEEARIVQEALAGQTPRTSYYAASTLDPEVANHYHDMELCLLLHQESESGVHEVVKRALRKAVRQRVKKLGMKYDTESIKQYKKSHHDHDPSVHLRAIGAGGGGGVDDEPPKWAADLKRELVLMQQRIESLGPKIENLRSSNRSFGGGDGSRYYDGDDYTRTPMTQTVNIRTQPGTMADSMYQAAETEIVDDDDEHEGDFDEMTETPHRVFAHNHGTHTDGETRTQNRSNYAMSDNRDDSPGQQFLEEELYKLRQKPQGSQSARSHRTWEVARDDEGDESEDGNRDGVAPSGLPTIPDSNGEGYPDQERSSSPPLPALPGDGNGEVVTAPQQQMWHNADYSADGQHLPPWQRIHQRLLSWAIIWPANELDQALNSTTRGHQVDEVALSIWSTQTYKRYVRARLTDSPQGVVDRLFVPPNMADAISNAVFHGRHGDACGMLRDLWSPFGLEGMPRLLIVLAKHRSDENHWVVHRFSLPDGALTTYDSYPERTLPDGRPLGWWFAIRVAWPNAIYPSPDHLMQKMVRLHRPMQLPIDNSVAAAGIWRNILMGSRAERSLDLERLRDLINTEVKNLRQRKQLGKLSIGGPRPNWEDLN